MRLVDTFDPAPPVTTTVSPLQPPPAERLWAVGPLMRAVADTLAARFNPVAVQGEISGFSRAASGHCYFSLKDDTGQVRCAMFRRAAEQLNFSPRDGQRVQVRGKLDVYGPRGELQLIVDSMAQAGQGALFEQFLRLKAELEAEGLFDPDRKRALPVQPHHIGVVTSLGAAALRDVATALRRRVPHLPVTLFPTSVQGTQAPVEIVAALDAAYRHAGPHGPCDVLLLVRGGGSLEDLWSFNEAAVVRAIAAAPMPVIVGVGHETDFTLADFVADLRAPTPTAAAELCSVSRAQRLDELGQLRERLAASVASAVDLGAQRLDRLAQRLGRPSARVHDSRQALARLEHRLDRGRRLVLQQQQLHLQNLAHRLPSALGASLERQRQRVERAERALSLLDPRLVLARGFAYLTDETGRAVVSQTQAAPGQALTATVSDGRIDLTVRRPGAA